MPTHAPALEISLTDPRAPDAAALLAAMTTEITTIYDHKIDGAGNFRPEDVLVPGSGFIVGRVENEAVACGAFRPLQPGIAEIKRMFVEPEARGLNIGRRMLAALEAIARAEGVRVVRLETGVRQPEALGLYRSCGYIERGPFGSYKPDPLSAFFEKRIA